MEMKDDQGIPMRGNARHRFRGRAMANDDGANVKLVYDQPLPNVPGKSMRGVLVEYEPGGARPYASALRLHLRDGS
jgi:hypothetical protein